MLVLNAAEINKLNKLIDSIKGFNDALKPKMIECNQMVEPSTQSDYNSIFDTLETSEHRMARMIKEITNIKYILDDITHIIEEANQNIITFKKCMNKNKLKYGLHGQLKSHYIDLHNRHIFDPRIDSPVYDLLDMDYAQTPMPSNYIAGGKKSKLHRKKRSNTTIKNKRNYKK
jgi:hypothetical protein